MTTTISGKMLLIGCTIGVMLAITIAYCWSQLFAQEPEELERWAELERRWASELRPRMEEYIQEKSPAELVMRYFEDPENAEAQRDIMALLLLDYFGRHIEEPGMWSTFADLDTRSDRIWIDRRTRDKYEQLERSWEQMQQQEQLQTDD